MGRPTFVEVNLNNVMKNVSNLKRIASGAKLMAVVKADGYGHGSIQVASAALDSGADWLGVAIPEEAEALRHAGIGAPILVLGGITPGMEETVLKHGLRQTVFDEEGVRLLENCAAKTGRKARIHIKVDTGMSRIGIREIGELMQLARFIKECRHVELEGLFTHFAAADAKNIAFTLKQKAVFDDMAAQIRKMGFSPMIHAANSAAILRLPQTHYDMVRAGISVYGYYGSDEVEKIIPLYPAMEWKTHVMMVKTLPPGVSVSYGRTFVTKRKTAVATLPVGYGDGYKRVLSSRASVLIKGNRAPVLGRVCMDQLMVDVTGIEGVKTGDEAVLLGRQGMEMIDAEEMAKWADTISYEILLSISPRVPRIYLHDDDISANAAR
ncbi:MAG: alanine racemase [Bacillota bacterium]|nr:alanine racemase [Bacillota bacterium]